MLIIYIIPYYNSFHSQPSTRPRTTMTTTRRVQEGSDEQQEGSRRVSSLRVCYFSLLFMCTPATTPTLAPYDDNDHRPWPTTHGNPNDGHNSVKSHQDVDAGTIPPHHTTQWRRTRQSSRRATGGCSEAQNMSNDMSWAVGYVSYIYTIVLLTFYMFIGTYYYLYQCTTYKWHTTHERGPNHANDVLGCWVSFFYIYLSF
jgi:hypothetical protein